MSFGDAATRPFDETEQVGDFRRASDLFADAFYGLGGIEFGRQEQVECMMKRIDRCARIAATLHTGDVESVALGVIANGASKRQGAFTKHGVTTDGGYVA